MYAIWGFLYFPFWMCFAAFGFPWFGIAAAAVIIFAGWCLLWKMEFGDWRFWKG